MIKIRFKKSSVFLAIALFTPLAPAFCDEPDRDRFITQSLDAWEKAERHHKEIVSGSSWSQSDMLHSKWRMDKEDQQDFPLKKQPRPAEMTPAPPSQNHTLEMGTQYFYAKYEEPEVMEQRGNLFGFQGAYTYRPDEGQPLYFPVVNHYRAEGMFAWGDFKYEAEAASQAGLQVDKEDYMYDVRGLVGMEYGEDNLTLMPFGGFGYRYLNDDDDGSLVVVGGTGYYGYERKANYYYVPMGMEVTIPMDQRWKMRLNGEYDFLVYGKQNSYLSDGNVYVSSPNDDFENEQHNGYGIRGSVAFLRDTVWTAFSIEPFVRYWSIEESEATSGLIDGALVELIEPKNHTVEGGIKVGLVF